MFAKDALNVWEKIFVVREYRSQKAQENSKYILYYIMGIVIFHGYLYKKSAPV